MLYNNKQVSGWNKSLDINGNAIAKIFYEDNTSEVLGNGKSAEFINSNGNSSYSKFYQSLSGLRNSKLKQL